MPGTKAGGLKARETNLKRHGMDFYHNIGRIGGQNGHTGGFASDEIGKDGISGRERARVAGSKGGAKSKRGPKYDMSLHKRDIERMLETGLPMSEIARRLKLPYTTVRLYIRKEVINE